MSRPTNQAFYAGDKAHEFILKMSVTDDYLMVEPKGRDASLSANHLHIIMSSNETSVSRLNESARRFWVLDVQSISRGTLNTSRRSANRWMAAGAKRCSTLLRRDISNFDVEAFPETEAGNEQGDYAWPASRPSRWAHRAGARRGVDKETGKTTREERITSNYILYDHLHVQSHAEAMPVSRGLPKAMLSLGWTGPKKVCLRMHRLSRDMLAVGVPRRPA